MLDAGSRGVELTYHTSSGGWRRRQRVQASIPFQLLEVEEHRVYLPHLQVLSARGALFRDANRLQQALPAVDVPA